MSYNLDANILLMIQEYIRTPYLTPIFKFITTLGDHGDIWILIAVILLCFKRTRKFGVLALIALFFAYLIDNVLLKSIIARVRPYEVIDNLHILINKPHDFSFPSGHTGSSFAAAIIIYQALPRKYGVLIIALATLIGISRLYLGVHYPSDVIGGAIIGSLIGMSVYKIFIYLESKKIINVNT